MADQNLMTACVHYFKARSVYQKLFEKAREKWIGLGHPGGSVTLQSLSPDEKRQLGGFFQKDYTMAKTVTISYVKMEKALADSRFSELDWQDILEAYFGEPLVARKEQLLQESAAQKAYFEEIGSFCHGTPTEKWLKAVLQDKKFGYQQLIQQYHAHPEILKNVLAQLSQVIEHLPMMNGQSEKILLPVYAARLTGNPHALDEGTDLERFLWTFLQWYFQTDYPGKAEFKNKVYYEAGLLKDALSNDVMIYGLHGQMADGRPHPGMAGFAKEKEIMKLTLQTIGKLKGISSDHQVVYMVENPAVFAYLSEKYPEESLICGYGQLKLAVWELLDKIAPETKIYYMGDFDPEGLQIADKLKKRYGDQLVCWHYDTQLYAQYVSDVSLSESRLQKLESIESIELQEMRRAIKNRRKAAYQEAMIEAIVIERATMASRSDAEHHGEKSNQ